jgi:hypothetical protein
MPDLATILERESRTVGIEPGALERVRRLRLRRQRNRRLGSAVLAIVVTVGALGYAWATFHRARTVPLSTITIDNVSDLQLAWSRPSPMEVPTVAGDEIWTTGWGDGSKSSFYELKTLPLGCSIGDKGCQAKVVATLGLDFSGKILVGSDAVYTGAGPDMTQFAPSEVTGSKFHGSISAYPRSCPGQPCAALWKGVIGAAGRHDHLTPVAEFGGRVYAVTTKGGSLFAFATACAHPTCGPVWSAYATGVPVEAGSRAIVYDKAGVEAFPSRCWSADGPSCSPLWTATLDGINHPSAHDVPQISQGLVLASDARGISAFPLDCRGRCSPRWTAPIPGGPGFPLVVANGLVISAASGGTDLLALPLDCVGTCEPRWVAQSTDGVGFEPVVTDGQVFVAATLGSSLVSYPLSCSSTCEPTQEFSLPDSIEYRPTVSGGLVFVSGTTGVAAFPTHCQTACAPAFSWTLPNGHPNDQPMVAGDTLLMPGATPSTKSGSRLSYVLYALRPALGSAQRPAAGPRSWIVSAVVLAGIIVWMFVAFRRRRIVT